MFSERYGAAVNRQVEKAALWRAIELEADSDRGWLAYHQFTFELEIGYLLEIVLQHGLIASQGEGAAVVAYPVLHELAQARPILCGEASEIGLINRT
jgi:hypothetical protein